MPKNDDLCAQCREPGELLCCDFGSFVLGCGEGGISTSGPAMPMPRVWKDEEVEERTWTEVEGTPPNFP